MSSKSSHRDFSLFSLFTAGLACFAPLVSAYTKPVGSTPKGNPIFTPGLHDIVPVDKPYQIKWNPTTQGTVTLVLLHGPADNAVPLYPIVEKIPNNGKYMWTPSEKLQPSNGDTGYGIQLICDATGQYQYTTQFGKARIMLEYFHVVRSFVDPCAPQASLIRAGNIKAKKLTFSTLMASNLTVTNPTGTNHPA